MGFALISFIQTHWPFAPRKLDDLELSRRLVNGLDIPDTTKEFVYAIVEPESQAVIYILSAQNLSKQSAIDAELLIKEVRPDVVVTQVSPSSLGEMKTEEKIDERNCRNRGGSEGNANSIQNPLPTSIFGVMKDSFVEKINVDKYESLAGSFVLKEIFGVGFYGHFLAAEKAAKEVGSSVFFIESPFVSSCADGPSSDGEASEGLKTLQSLGLKSSSLVPQKLGTGVLSKHGMVESGLRSETVKSLASALSQLNEKGNVSGSVSEARMENCQQVNDYKAPSFAQTVYSLLIDLHSVFGNIPTIQTALANAKKMLHSVDKGETVNTQLLSEVQNFQIAVEGLRVGLNTAGRYPINQADSSDASKSEFSELPIEDKSHALLAQAIRSQTQNSKSIVAIVDASSLAGLRKHWKTPLPPEVKDMIEQFVIKYEGDEEKPSTQNSEKKRLIADNPMVAVGAGATAILGASSFCKAVPVSAFMKLVPASLKLAMYHTKKAAAISLSKVFGPSKIVGFMTSGSLPTSVAKAATSAKNISTVTHSVRAYAQRTSFSAIRTAFYEIMRKRSFQPVGYTPWVKFGCSVSACAGLLVYGDGIECVVESMPVAPAIASLGRGLQNLHQANQVVKQPDGARMQEAIQSLLYRFKQ